MKDLICDEFQNTVSELLMRHHSILDVLSKLQEASARTNRATVKSVTGCGCIQVDAKKKSIPPEVSLVDLKDYFESHLRGQLCPNCREIIEIRGRENPLLPDSPLQLARPEPLRHLPQGTQKMYHLESLQPD